MPTLLTPEELRSLYLVEYSSRRRPPTPSAEAIWEAYRLPSPPPLAPLTPPAQDTAFTLTEGTVATTPEGRRFIFKEGRWLVYVEPPIPKEARPTVWEHLDD